MRGVPLHRQTAHLEHEVVAVGADKGQAALELGAAPSRERRAELLGERARGTRFGRGLALFRVSADHRQRPTEARIVIGAGDSAVGLGHGSREIGCQRQARLDHFRAKGDELVVPDVESRC